MADNQSRDLITSADWLFVYLLPGSSGSPGLGYVVAGKSWSKHLKNEVGYEITPPLSALVKKVRRPERGYFVTKELSGVEIGICVNFDANTLRALG